MPISGILLVILFALAMSCRKPTRRPSTREHACAERHHAVLYGESERHMLKIDYTGEFAASAGIQLDRRQLARILAILVIVVLILFPALAQENPALLSLAGW
ncbi:hypothetical protein [Actinomadura sp. 6N118]|uniref:hypothetical protein n=1 Tax=Actinomadura sp. 6N118 TaxID=3375151 RepID=UPI0037A97F2C